MPSSSLNLKEKLSPEEAAKLVVLLDREVPVSHYAKFINERTGEEVDIEEVKKQRQPKPSSCYEYFLDYSNCHVRLLLHRFYCAMAFLCVCVCVCVCVCDIVLCALHVSNEFCSELIYFLSRFVISMIF